MTDIFIFINSEIIKKRNKIRNQTITLIYTLKNQVCSLHKLKNERYPKEVWQGKQGRRP